MKLKVRFNYTALIMLLVFFLSLVGCTSSEKLIEFEYRGLQPFDSTLIYEYKFTTSSATGNCVGVAIDRWYGTEEKLDTLLTTYDKQLSNTGWVVWSEDIVPVWRKENKEGLFSFSLNAFTDKGEMEINRGYYNLPNSILLEATKYQIVYVTTLSHMSSANATRCFSR